MENKSNVVHFRKKRSAKSKYSFKLGDVCLNTVDRYQYLGLIFYEYLTFDFGVNDLCLKDGRALCACISRFKALKNVRFITFTKLYNCMDSNGCPRQTVAGFAVQLLYLKHMTCTVTL